jgi:hypothetical protein
VFVKVDQHSQVSKLENPERLHVRTQSLEACPMQTAPGIVEIVEPQGVEQAPRLTLIL